MLPVSFVNRALAERRESFLSWCLFKSSPSGPLRAIFAHAKINDQMLEKVVSDERDKGNIGQRRKGNCGLRGKKEISKRWTT